MVEENELFKIDRSKYSVIKQKVLTGINPEQYAKCGTEHAIQVALFAWAALPETKIIYPDLEVMFAIPNGGLRDKITAARLKAEGVKAGVCDIFLPVPIIDNKTLYHGLFLELKKKGEYPKKIQYEFRDKMQKYGYAATWSDNYESAKQIISSYLATRKRMLP